MPSSPYPCPLCCRPATKAPVPGKFDNRIECTRCGSYDINRYAEVNLASSGPPPNASTLSGIARVRHELYQAETPPRLIWVELAEDRDGRYEFDGIPSGAVTAREKAERFIDFLQRKTNRTAGEPVVVHYQTDVSLAF